MGDAAVIVCSSEDLGLLSSRPMIYVPQGRQLSARSMAALLKGTLIK